MGHLYRVPTEYRGGSQPLIENSASGRVGLGMAYEERGARKLRVTPYPHMLRWLCDLDVSGGEDFGRHRVYNVAEEYL